IGQRNLLNLKVSVDANMTVYEGHNISDQIKAVLLQLDGIEYVIVHVNPTQYHPQCI
ncbi:MAG: cation-efflux pump, partial [Vallitaleaceae bacterium]|nr:cation-efflux pump [Vallitaleaceae bacterium]